LTFWFGCWGEPVVSRFEGKVANGEACRYRFLSRKTLWIVRQPNHALTDLAASCGLVWQDTASPEIRRSCDLFRSVLDPHLWSANLNAVRRGAIAQAPRRGRILALHMNVAEMASTGMIVAGKEEEKTREEGWRCERAKTSPRKIG
jgi:hypothetical protein